MTEYQICNRCVMDTSAENIVFDANGFCNFCTDFIVRLDKVTSIIADEISRKDDFVNQIKKSGINKPYDCIVGVSGGVDSSYALYLAIKNGLRPLAVHLDNGWNSELAVHNISSLVTNLNVDLYTHVIDWEENRDLQLSFFNADVVDIEMLMDNAMFALNYSQAAKRGIKYILAGTNMATEGLAMPQNWCHFKFDKKNIKNIQKRFGKSKIKTHPLMSTLDFIKFEFIKKAKWISFLDYFPYNKNEALEILKKEVDYKPYPYKHYESVFTRFYQAYILPEKFGYDKRRVHLSTLVAGGQMDRSEALKNLKTSPYPDAEQEKQDKEFVLKKLGFTEESFERYIKDPPVPHSFYGSEKWLWDFLMIIYRRLKKI